MAEIISADKFADELIDLCGYNYSQRGIRRKIEEYDAAIIERCKEAICDFSDDGLIGIVVMMK
jgi:hypothetical protein